MKEHKPKQLSHIINRNFISKLFKNQYEPSDENEQSNRKLLTTKNLQDVELKSILKMGNKDKQESFLNNKQHFSNIESTITYKDKLRNRSVFNSPKKKGLQSFLTTQSNTPKPKKGPLSSLLFDMFVNHKKSNEEQHQLVLTYKLELLHHKLQLNSFLQALLAILSISVTIFHLSAIPKGIDNTYDDIKYSVTSVCFLSTLIIGYLIILEYIMISEVVALTRKVPSWIWRHKMNNIISLILSLLFIIIHPNPVFVGINVPYYSQTYDVYVKYELNDIFSLFEIPRILFILKAVLFNSQFTAPRILRLARMNGISLDFLFSFKCLMKNNPYLTYSICFTMFVLFGTFGIIVGERPFVPLNGVELDSWWNSIWCTIITILTVGYGDFTPKSLIGRIIVIFSAFGGAFLLSMLIATFSSLLSFDEGERTVCSIIDRIYMHKDKESKSVKLIMKYIALMNLLKTDNTNTNTFHKEFQSKKNDIVMINMDLKESVNKIKESYNEEAKDEYVIEQTKQIENNLELLMNKFNCLSKRLEKLDIKENSQVVDNQSEENDIFHNNADDTIQNKSIFSDCLLNSSIIN